MDAISMKYIAVGLMSISMFGAAIGVGNIFGRLLESIARNPSASKQLEKNAFIGAALAEAMGLFALLICIILLFVL